MTNAINTTDILIIGAGPVGLTAALEAQRLGLTARIIDRKPARSTNDSRALIVHPRVLELLAPNAKVVEKITRANIHPQCVNVHFNPPITLAFDQARWGDTDFTPSWLPQYETERILEEEIGRNGDAVEYGVSLDALSQNESGVTATLRCKDGKEEEITCKYVIGCDGGRSKTRELVGVNMHRSPSRVYFVVADVSFSGDSPISVKKELHFFPTEEGIGVMFPLPGYKSFRLLFQTPKGITNKSNVSLDKAFLEALLLERTGLKFEVTLGEWQTIFEITHGVSEKFRKGRVFLAGDASHVHSPVGGQGMNYGMQDVCNLLWKLAWAKRCGKQFPQDKKSVETILDTYNCERHAMGEELISSVDFMTMLLTTRNRGTQKMRNLMMRLLLPVVAKDAFRKAGQLELKYNPNWSPIIFDAPLFSKRYICKPGQRLPNLLLADDEHLQNLMNRDRHTWVFVNTEAPKSLKGMPSIVAVSLNRSAGQSSIPSIPENRLVCPQVILVRPDLFVAGVDSTYKQLKERVEKVIDAASFATM